MTSLLKEYLAQYGYLVLFAGTVLEGEAILILAGYLSFQGYLSLPLVMVVAFAGAIVGDQAYFYIGRWQGSRLLRVFTFFARKFHKALNYIERYGSFVAFISRYTYGFRILLPIVLGMTSYSSRKFLVMNILSAAVWAVLFSSAGFLFGKGASLFIEDIEKYEPHLLLALFLLIMLSWVLHFIRSWWKGRGARSRLRRIRISRKQGRE